MRLATIRLLCVIATLASCVAAAASTRPPARSVTEAQFVALINATRRAHHLRPLRFSLRLRRAARAHSADMLAHGYFEHDSLRELWAHRVRRYMPHARLVAETLAWGSGAFAYPPTLVRWWLASPRHRAVLLDPKLQLIGVGLGRGRFHGERGALVVTADFARR